MIFHQSMVKIIAVILAIIGLCVGVNVTFFQTRGFVETTAVITDLTEEGSGDDTTYRPTVEYEVDGETYIVKLDNSVKADSVGNTITVLYDPSNPELAYGKNGMGIYLLIVCPLILAFVLISIFKGRRERQENKERQELSGYRGYAPHVEGGERELYFLTDLGTPKAGHRIEDENRRVLYEAKMTKFGVAVDYKFDFIDHEHGKTVPHLVGQVLESTWGTLLADVHDTFEFDGVDIWKHLKQNGISVESSVTAGEGALVGMEYRILRDGEEIAHAVQTSQFPHEEDTDAHKVEGKIPIPGFYRIWTTEVYLDLLFVTLMAFARSGAGDDKGGTYGAILGTLDKMKNNEGNI